jgi:hypothetical protein
MGMASTARGGKRKPFQCLSIGLQLTSAEEQDIMHTELAKYVVLDALLVIVGTHGSIIKLR